ncbi:hypothetical protein RRG08_058932 [Elysia crispata]|uniref:Uncharacterized protein n=1 Tax=Elysia crispata TaxID=231223 RepID=A0AAE1CL49_9GAST|nr:hypothetical protein RRG08_058932 [Elysia crispata]
MRLTQLGARGDGLLPWRITVSVCSELLRKKMRSCDPTGLDFAYCRSADSLGPGLIPRLTGEIRSVERWPTTPALVDELQGEEVLVSNKATASTPQLSSGTVTASNSETCEKSDMANLLQGENLTNLWSSWHTKDQLLSTCKELLFALDKDTFYVLILAVWSIRSYLSREIEASFMAEPSEDKSLTRGVGTPNPGMSYSIWAG